ncbi:MAG: coenzyme F420-0:L-glutamate ligase [Hydrogenoanaerobacterium sp.]
MSRTVGAVSRGIRAPIIRKGDDLANIVVSSVLEAAQSEGFAINEKDVIGITEAVVARAQGNYATVDNIADDIKQKFPTGEFGILFPIMSRNRFAICLRGIARGAKKLTIMMSYPSDEVGNELVSLDLLDEKGVNPWTDVLSEEKYRELFGSNLHRFTGVDYITYYRELCAEEGAEVNFIFANSAKAILGYTKNVLVCDIHTRVRSKRLLKDAGASAIYGLDEVMSKPVNGSGFNADYGLLGSNKATEQSVKLFPRDCDAFVADVQAHMLQATGKLVEVMVYGDGAFKDPVGKIWELADPVVSPAFTAGLIGQPNEVKLKYLADNNFAELSGDALRSAITDYIKKRKTEEAVQAKASMETQGTTPRRLTDLLGSLCDLTTGSGDKGTPIVLIQGYFDKYVD